MKISKDRLWTWLLPDKPGGIIEEEWVRQGGKWIVFDRKERILELARKLAPFIDSGEVESAKYWNGDPSGLNVYCLDKDREETLAILKTLGAGRSCVWEYDYAWDKNLRSPLAFAYSWCSKFGTIIRSYGIGGTMKLVRDILILEKKV